MKYVITHHACNPSIAARVNNYIEITGTEESNHGSNDLVILLTYFLMFKLKFRLFKQYFHIPGVKRRILKREATLVYHPDVKRICIASGFNLVVSVYNSHHVAKLYLIGNTAI